MPAAMIATLCAVSLAPGQDPQTDTKSMDQTAVMRPSPAKLAIWTDRLGYPAESGQLSVYLAMAPMGDGVRYTEFTYLENIATGRRTYFAREADPPRARDEIMDARGRMSVRTFETRRVDTLAPTRIWTGPVPQPGQWQFVAELRSPDTTEVVKTAHAKFVVSEGLPVAIGAGGTDTEIAVDTTWTADRIHAIRHQVFVNAGATLTIEPGTLVLARGRNAVIVVERGGRIMAEGRRDAPIVMTCDEPVGQRSGGCWGGLIVRGRAPVASGTALAVGVVPEARPAYGGDDPADSSGALRYVRVEFAGAGPGSRAQPAGLGLHGVGSGTAIDHVQVHESAGDGIQFVGGAANCTHCVSSGAADDGLDWAGGWQGTVQYVFLQQNPGQGDCGIEADSAGQASRSEPRPSPRLYNLTLTGGPQQAPESNAKGVGIVLRGEDALTARNLIVTGFPAAAVRLPDRSLPASISGASILENSILHANGTANGGGQAGAGVEPLGSSSDADPLLVNARYEANPDPRPKLGSPALAIGAGTVPPSDGTLDPRGQSIGAFSDSNWLEEWTFFGDESDYVPPE